jgi:transcriptional regulator with XRE-family HTH domain
MTPEEIRQLCQALECTSRELAATLEIDPVLVRAWQQGDRFPTKRLIERMRKLRELGPSAVVRTHRGRRAATTSGVLQDPRLWDVLQQIVEHPELLDRVVELVERQRCRHDEP